MPPLGAGVSLDARAIRVGEYVLALEKQEIGDDRLVVYRAGEIVYFTAGQCIYLEPFPGAELGGSRSDAYITGDGRPSALLTTWSGGVHRGYELIVLELGERFREVARIYGQDSVFAVEDLDGRACKSRSGTASS